MSKIKQWTEGDVHYAEAGGYRGWSRLSAQGALMALHMVMPPDARDGFDWRSEGATS